MTDNAVDPADFTKYDPIPPEVEDELTVLLHSGELFRYGGKPERSPASLLERDFADYIGMKYAVAVNSCSSAIFLALRLLGVEAGHNVLVPAFTFTAVPSAIVQAGGVPVLVESTDDFRMDIADFRRKAPQAKVLLLSHMRGYVSDLDEIAKICEQHGIVMIEDAAHALGCLWNGKPVGSFGKIGCFSFQSNKIINAGEGGVLTTDDEELAVKAIILSGAYENLYRYHMIDSRLFDQHKKLLPLFNMRITNLAAAIARPQLRSVDERGASYRNLHAALVMKLTAASNLLAFPQEDPREIRVPDSIQFRVPSFGREQMEHFIGKTKEAKLPLSCLGIDKDNARTFWNWGYIGDVPNMEATRKILSTTCDMRLPALLTEAHLDYIAEAIGSAARLAATA